MLNEHDPNTWGEGQLLAFSGLDGDTSLKSNLVLHTGSTPGTLILKLPVELLIQFRNTLDARLDLLLNDCCEGQADGGPYRFAFLDHRTLVGAIPEKGSMVIGGSAIRDVTCVAVTSDAERDSAVYAAARKGRWALFCGRPGEFDAAAERLEEALSTDLEEAVKQRAQYVENVAFADDLPDEWQSLYRKAVSVQKVNVESAQSGFSRRWTTPDRWPHRFLWLWDSAFHAMGLVHHNPEMAREAIEVVLEQQRDDGMVPHMIKPDGEHSDITQPPILTWATRYVFENSETDQDTADWVERLLPRLKRYLDFDYENRDKNGNSIPEWQIEASELCRSGESGLDNSPRFDAGMPLDAVDFASWLANDYECLAELAGQHGLNGMSEDCLNRRAEIAGAVRSQLWCEERNFFYDRDFDGRFCGVKAISGFMPLLAGIADEEQAERLRRHLETPSTFGTPLPCPSVSVDSGAFSKDMWRGPVWLNTAYMVYEGLQRYGFDDVARRLRDTTLTTVRKWYTKEGCLFEFYDALDVTIPRDLDRKQRFMLQRGIAPISDYGWTAAITILLLHDLK